MRTTVSYRVDGGACRTGFAESTCSGSVVYPTPIGGEPVDGAVVVSNSACPDEVAVVNMPEIPKATNCNGNTAVLVFDECAADAQQGVVDALGQVVAQLQAINGNTDALEALQAATTAAVAAQTQYIDQVETLLATLGTQTDQLEPLLTQLGLNTDQVESKLDTLATLLTPTTRIVKTGTGYISSGTGTTNFGGSPEPYASVTGLQSITVTVVQSGKSAVGNDVVEVTTDSGKIKLLAGMTMTFSVEQDSYNKAEELSNVFKAEALGNSAAIVHYTYAGTVTPVRTEPPHQTPPAPH